MVLLFFLARNLNASPDVNPDNPIEGLPLSVGEGLGILRSTGCMPSFIHGDMIKTQREIARLLVEAKDCLYQKKEGHQLAINIYEKLKRQYNHFYKIAEKSTQQKKRAYLKGDDAHVTLPLFRVTNIIFSEDERSIPTNSIDTDISPWREYNDGYQYSSGYNFLISAKSSISVGSWFDFSLEPYFLTNDDHRHKASIQTTNLKFTPGNFEIKAGRSYLLWGEGHEGRVIFSDNSKPMDMVQIGNPYPVTLPWIFKAFGPFQYRFFLGVLNKNRTGVEYPRVLSGRIMMKPLHNLEFGLTRSLMFGGNGSPKYSWWQPIGELFGFRPKDGWIFNIPFKESARGGTAGIANNVLGLDVRWRIPALRNTEFFFELYNEDPLDVGDFFPEDSIFHLGFWIPRLTKEGDLQMLIEGSYAAKIVYTHGVFPSGFTNRRKIMGMAEGPYNFNFNIKLTKLYKEATKLWSSIEYQHYWSDIYGPTRPNDEKRFIFKIGGVSMLSDKMRMDVAGGIQTIIDYNFTSKERAELFGKVGLTYQF